MNAKSMFIHSSRKFTSWDRKIQNYWLGIKLKWRNDEGSWLKFKIDRKEVKWKLPSKNWIKVNLDNASKGNPRISRVGAIARNELGDIVAFATKCLRDVTNNLVEV